MRIKAFTSTAVAAAAFVLFSNTAALADITYGFAFHNSIENYYMTGSPGAPGSPTGTQVACTTGCADFNVPGPGLPNGNVFWEVHEKAFYGTDDSANEFTKIEYAVFNDAFDPELITSFHVPTNGRVPVTILSPLNWSGGYSNGVITWVAGSGFGIGAPAVFTAIYEGFLPIIFELFVFVDLGDGSVFTSADWVVSTVPEPTDGQDCCENGKPVVLTMQYTGDDCSATSHSQDPSKVACDDFGALPSSVFIVAANRENLGHRNTKVWFSGDVDTSVNNGEFDIDAGNAGQNKLASNTFIHVFDEEGGTLLQRIKFHTSCSQPLLTGDQFGSTKVVDCIGEDVPIGCDIEDGVCAPGEDCESCPSDCDSKTNGRPSGRYCCGNGVQEGPEGDGRCDGNF